ELGLVDDPGLERVVLRAVQPVLVVRRAQVHGGRHQLDAVPEGVDTEQAGSEVGREQREGRLLPLRPEDRLLLRNSDRTQPVRAAAVVDAVHAALPTVLACGAGNPPPACSNAWATRRTVASSKCLPMIIIPVGNPLTTPAGTLQAG